MDNVRGIRNKYHMWICHEGEDFDEISLSNWEFPIFLQIEQTLTGLLLKNSGLLLEIKRMLSFSLSYSEEASGVSNFTEVQRPVAIFPKWLLCLSSHPLQSVTSRQNSEDTNTTQ